MHSSLKKAYALLDLSVRVGGIAIGSTLKRLPTLRGAQEHITGSYRSDPLFIGREAIGRALVFPAAFNAARDDAIVFC